MHAHASCTHAFSWPASSARSTTALPAYATTSGYVNCDPFSDHLTYSGYEVEAFRYIANSIGWIEVSPQLLSNDSAFSLSIISYFFNCTILSQPQVVGILTSYTHYYLPTDCHHLMYLHSKPGGHHYHKLNPYHDIEQFYQLLQPCWDNCGSWQHLCQ